MGIQINKVGRPSIPSIGDMKHFSIGGKIPVGRPRKVKHRGRPHKVGRPKKMHIRHTRRGRKREYFSIMG